MYELFKNVLILSLFGFGITTILLCLKPITSKKLPAKWQYYVWVAVLFLMVIPAYTLIPQNEAQKIPLIPQNQIVTERSEQVNGQNAETVIIEQTPIEYREIPISPKHQIRLLDLIAYIWFFGVCIFLLAVFTSYIVYIINKRKNAVILESNDMLEKVKKELNIKRQIKIRMSPEVNSPMLVGVFCPVVYIPCRAISDENMRMIFLHELTHYKRKDLMIKWFSIFVNAVHWFNPLAYLLCANISESCEVSCDMAVTKNMSDIEQKIYMKTILDLVEEKE